MFAFPPRKVVRLFQRANLTGLHVANVAGQSRGTFPALIRFSQRAWAMPVAALFLPRPVPPATLL